MEDDENYVKKYNKLKREHQILEKKHEKLVLAYKNLRETSLRKYY